MCKIFCESCFQVNKMKSVVIAFAALGLTTGVANAASILQPVGVSSSVGSYKPSGAYHISSVINQSGLTEDYTSNVTDFDEYVRLTMHSDQEGNWYSPYHAGPATITFDLGGTYTLDAFALWGDFNNAGEFVKDFTLSASTDSSFANKTVIGSFSAADGTGYALNNFAQIFNFGATIASYIRMDILSNHGGNYTGFGEAAFRISDAPVSAAPSAVPLPAALPLLATGMIGLGVFAWRRKTA